MADSLWLFEGIVRATAKVGSPSVDTRIPEEHPFEIRNIHPLLPNIVRGLFDDGHYAQATFEAFKFVDKEVARLSNFAESGFKLMMAVFPENGPVISLTKCGSATERDEQKGFQFLFAGSMLAIRNPRGHEYAVRDSPDQCLDHLALASILLRRLEASGYTLNSN